MKRVKSRVFVLYCIIAILLVGNIFQFVCNNTNHLSVVAVPDEETALKIAESVLVSVYGDDVLLKNPFNATFDDSRRVWVIVGSLPEGYVGGVPEIVIRKSDGKIIKIYHGK